MFARMTRLSVAIFGLLVLIAPEKSHVAQAQTAQCNTRQQITFVNAGDTATENAIALVACATSRVRGLVPKAPVSVRLLDAATLRTTIGQITQAEVTAESLRGATLSLQMLGGLGPKQDLATIKRGLYNLGNAADYDTRTKTLYVRTGKPAFSPLDRATIAHEYTHALQDQYFGLIALLANAGGSAGHNSDALLARQAVTEGDAFATMLAYAATFSRQDQVLFNQQLQRSVPGQQSDYAHDRIAFPGAQGTIFIKALMVAAAKGKKGIAAINAGIAAVNHAFSAPPASTQEVVNPTLYIEHVQTGTNPPVVQAQITPDWQQVDSDVLGPYSIGDLFGQHNQLADTTRAANQAAASWQGDRWIIYQRGQASMMVWRAHFDSAAGAKAFQRAVIAYTAMRFHASLNPGTSLDWHTTGFAASVHIRGTDVAVAVGSSADLLATCTKAVNSMGFS